jgi:ferredoxin
MAGAEHDQSSPHVHAEQREQEERTVHGLRVRIDRTLCVGFGDCVTASPEAFVLDDTDVAVFRAPESVHRDQLLRACASCPVDALTVWDEAGEQIVP